jgi:predicted deacylase
MRVVTFVFFASTLSGVVYSEGSISNQAVPIYEDDLAPSDEDSKLERIVSHHHIVAPNINLKEVAPPPEALKEVIPSLPKKEPPKKVKSSPKVITDSVDANNSDPKNPAVSITESVEESGLSSLQNVLQTEESSDAGSAIQPDEKASESVVIQSSDEDASLATPVPFVILGAEVQPGTSTRLGWTPGIAIAGLATPVPVLVINGEQPGKTFCLMAAIHGDELNGIEIVRRVIYDIDPKKLKGRIIGVPIVNLQGFQRNSRYLADRRDLNRYFPGTPQGSLASRIAYSLFKEVITHCDALIDLHTGSLRRTNLPQLRADMGNPQAVKFTEFFDDIVVVHSPGEEGMLRWAVAKKNIPAVTLEIGESSRLQEEQVNVGVKSINGVLDRMGMYSRRFTWGDPEPVYYRSTWVRAERGGILFSVVELGDNVEKGEILGNVTDPITNEVSSISAPLDGRIIGMTVNQVVMPGFAAYHLGIEASEIELSVKEVPVADNQTKDADIRDPE